MYSNGNIPLSVQGFESSTCFRYLLNLNLFSFPQWLLVIGMLSPNGYNTRSLFLSSSLLLFPLPLFLFSMFLCVYQKRSLWWSDSDSQWKCYSHWMGRVRIRREGGRRGLKSHVLSTVYSLFSCTLIVQKLVPQGKETKTEEEGGRKKKKKLGRKTFGC